MVNRTNLITWCRCYLSSFISFLQEVWGTEGVVEILYYHTLRKDSGFSCRKKYWHKYIYGLITNHQMNLLPMKVWHLLYISQKGWECNRQVETSIWYAEDEEEFSHWKVKQVLDICVLKNQHLNDILSGRSYLQSERSGWKEEEINASHSVYLSLVLQAGIV